MLYKILFTVIFLAWYLTYLVWMSWGIRWNPGLRSNVISTALSVMPIGMWFYLMIYA